MEWLFWHTQSCLNKIGEFETKVALNLVGGCFRAIPKKNKNETWALCPGYFKRFEERRTLSEISQG
jgi:histone acetyltransferase (RNA polymerase elongator complex component)